MRKMWQNLKDWVWRLKNRKLINSLYLIEEGKYKGVWVAITDKEDSGADDDKIHLNFKLYAHPSNIDPQTIDLEELTTTVTSELEKYLSNRVDEE